MKINYSRIAPSRSEHKRPTGPHDTPIPEGPHRNRVPPTDLAGYLTAQIERAEDEVSVQLPASLDVLHSLRSDREQHIALARKEMRTRLVCDSSILGMQGGPEELFARAAEGVEVKIRHGISQWRVLIDSKLLVIAGDSAGDLALIVTELPIVDLARDAFTATWSQAVRIDGARYEGVGRGSLSKATARRSDGGARGVLTALQDGLSDEAGARAQNMSLRTYRRHVAELMRRLGARSRFQAACLAKDRSWI